MRASTAVGLLLVSSMSIFGLHAHHNAAMASVEPVYVNGVMGVYNPDTGEFVPSTSPLFDQTCDLIQQRRQQSAGNYYSGSTYYHHWYYSPGSHYFTYPSGTGGASGFRSSGRFDGSSAHSGSIRGGFGMTGSAHGGAHA